MALGPHNWHKDLTCTTERTRTHRGYKGAGIVLVPTCRLGRQPLYEDREIAAHIATMRGHFPELKPSPTKPRALKVPLLDSRLLRGRHGFRWNKARKA